VQTKDEKEEKKLDAPGRVSVCRVIYKLYVIISIVYAKRINILTHCLSKKKES